jgi:ribonuclease R
MSIYKKYKDNRNRNKKNNRYSNSNKISRSSVDISSNLIGTVKRAGKKFIFIPRKFSKFYKSFDIETNGIRPRKNTIYLANLIQDAKKGLKVELKHDIGKTGSLDIERESLLFEYGLHIGFSDIVEERAKGIGLSISDSEVSKRVDLRKELIFTIDGDRARDYDDAVGIQKIKNGYKLWVSIADVSHYVKPSSDIDLEAYRRATSVYLTKRVVPMLPEKLSNNLCSLIPNDDRLTKTVEIVFDNGGNIKDYSVYKSIINSKYRLTYTTVSEILNGVQRLDKSDKKLERSLFAMKELYLKIKKIRFEAGYIDLNIPEADIVEDGNGNIIDIVKLSRDVAHELIEYFMITANQVVAEFINKSQYDSIYRIHDSLKEDSIGELKEKLRSLGYKKKIKSKIKAKDIQVILDHFRDTEKEYAANLFILRTMNRAVYSTRDVGHFGLGLNNYTHFTSPIRRYPDLVVHRIVDNLLENRESVYDLDLLNKISSHCSEKELFSDEVQRESIKLERAFLLKQHIGKVVKGIIISIQSFGLFVELNDIYAEGFVPRKKISKFDESKFHIGQDITVKISNSDIENRRVALDFLKLH